MVAMEDLVWEREWPPRTSIMVVAFSGYFDAASAATGAVDHLVETTAATRLARIESERFLDFQQTRPLVVLEDGVTRRVTWPENVIHANEDGAVGRELVLLSGIEPHYEWRRFADLVIDVARDTAAQLVITLGATPAATPHTRMPLVHASSSNPAIATRFGLRPPTYQGITGIVGVLHAAFDARSIAAISAQVGVPHYASGAPNVKASMALLQYLEHVTGIPTGHAALAEQVTEWEHMVDDAVAENPDARAYLTQLEAQHERRTAEQIPSSDDLAAELEQYLREQSDEPPEGDR
jgi:predicted ATP-grasp superfamily ATP-dependent carboligase